MFKAEKEFASLPPSTIRIPFAIPTTTAVPARSAAPDWKQEAMSLIVMLFSLKITAVRPAARPITKNWDAISGM